MNINGKNKKPICMKTAGFTKAEYCENALTFIIGLIKVEVIHKCGGGWHMPSGP
jgi:hypothetical protein